MLEYIWSCQSFEKWFMYVIGTAWGFYCGVRWAKVCYCESSRIAD